MRNPLTKDALADWAETRPSDKHYAAGIRSECAICQFLRNNGHPYADVNNTYWTTRDNDFNSVKFELEPFFDAAVQAEPHTFGALAQRLRA